MKSSIFYIGYKVVKRVKIILKMKKSVTYNNHETYNDNEKMGQKEPSPLTRMGGVKSRKRRKVGQKEPSPVTHFIGLALPSPRGNIRAAKVHLRLS